MGKGWNKQGWTDAELNLFNSLCYQVDGIRKKTANVEKQIKEHFIDKSNSNNAATRSDDSAPNGETNTTFIKEDFLGDGLVSIVKLICERKEKECNNSENDSDDSDNE